MILRRELLIALIVILIAGAIIYGFIPKPVPVEIATVSRGPLQVIIEEEGKTRLKDRFEISAPVSGTIGRMDWNVGDLVQAGQKLCEISPLKSALLDPRSHAEAEDRVAAAEASLRTAKSRVMADAASAQYARSEYNRIKQIYDKQMISRSELDRAEAEKRRANANLQSSRYAVDTARYSLEEAKNALAHFATEGDESENDRIAIHSPVKGQVLAVFKESEGVVSASQVLMEVGDPHALEVEVEVLSADAVRIKEGMPVLLDRWGGEEPLDAKVRLIEPVGFTKISALGVEEQRVRIIIDITSPTKEWYRLGDGYRVDARFILWQGEDVLQIPENALFRHNSGWAVFIVNRENKAELRQIERGKSSGLQAQIISGLEEGETVITHPDEQIEDGRKIRVEKN